MPEAYRILDDGRRVYAGYAKFDSDGNYLGTFGGYGSRANGTVSAKTPQGRGINNGNPRTGNNRKNKASMVQNAIALASAKAANRLRL